MASSSKLIYLSSKPDYLSSSNHYHNHHQISHSPFSVFSSQHSAQIAVAAASMFPLTTQATLATPLSSSRSHLERILADSPSAAPMAAVMSSSSNKRIYASSSSLSSYETEKGIPIPKLFFISSTN